MIFESASRTYIIYIYCKLFYNDQAQVSFFFKVYQQVIECLPNLFDKYDSWLHSPKLGKLYLLQKVAM